MMGFRPETRAKMMTAMKAESENPTLFKEIMTEFMDCFKSADANQDGLLNLEEFKAFNSKFTTCCEKRYGEASLPPVKE